MGNNSNTQKVESAIYEGELSSLKVAQLREYLKGKGLSDKGKKEELIDRIMVYISHQNSI